MACGHTRAAITNDNGVDETQHLVQRCGIAVDGSVDQVLQVARVGGIP